jgi:prepilin-type N-terminal cleavage/methylation domain-containing protein
MKSPPLPKIPSGFTLIEILMVLTLAAVVALPFTRLFSFGIQGSVDNLEHIIGMNLARDKIEEIKSLPFDAVKSDFENFREIYQDLPDFMEVYGSKEKFETFFSDIITPDRLKRDKEKEVCERFMETYKRTYYRDYEMYPDEVDGYRRFLDVDDKYDTAVPPRLKKIVVKVFDKKNHRVGELTTLIGRQR